MSANQLAQVDMTNSSLLPYESMASHALEAHHLETLRLAGSASLSPDDIKTLLLKGYDTGMSVGMDYTYQNLIKHDRQRIEQLDAQLQHSQHQLFVTTHKLNSYAFFTKYRTERIIQLKNDAETKDRVLEDKDAEIEQLKTALKTKSSEVTALQGKRRTHLTISSCVLTQK